MFEKTKVRGKPCATMVFFKVFLALFMFRVLGFEFRVGRSNLVLDWSFEWRGLLGSALVVMPLDRNTANNSKLETQNSKLKTRNLKNPLRPYGDIGSRGIHKKTEEVHVFAVARVQQVLGAQARFDLLFAP